MNRPILPNEEEEEIEEEDFFLEVVASLQQDDSITMLPVTKGRMFIPTPEIQEIASTTSFHHNRSAPEIQEIASTTSFHHNRNFKNLKVLLFVKFVVKLTIQLWIAGTDLTIRINQKRFLKLWLLWLYMKKKRILIFMWTREQKPI